MALNGGANNRVNIEGDDEGIPTVKALYSNFDGPGGYAQAARMMGFIDDVKAGVPRTAYKGVTIFKHNGCRKLLVDAEKQSKL
jgi:GNT-I family